MTVGPLFEVIATHFDFIKIRYEPTEQRFMTVEPFILTPSWHIFDFIRNQYETNGTILKDLKEGRFPIDSEAFEMVLKERLIIDSSISNDHERREVCH